MVCLDELLHRADLVCNAHEPPLARARGERMEGKHVARDDVALDGGKVREVLLGLELEGRRAARHGDRLCLESGEEVGVVTSGTFAPSLGKSIAFAWCRAGREGADSFVIDNGRAKLKARKVETPFYKDGTARMKLQ